MPTIGFHCSHEQIAPGRLLRDVQHAEQVGFTAAMSSDHLSPWSQRQGESGFAWSFLGAALAMTDLPFGVVTAPGQRYHPAVTAQAIATLAGMFHARLLECVEVIRRLLAGETVDHDGLVTVNRGRLWTLPDAVPPLIGPAVSAETAARHAAWADGMITVNQPLGTLRRVLGSYRDAGGRGAARLQVHLSWAPTDDEALAIAHDQWRSNVHGPPVSWDTETVEAFDVMAETVTPQQVAEVVNVSSDPAWHAARIQEYLDQGWDEVYLHHVGQRQEAFLDTFGERVLPQLAPAAPAPATTDRPAREREDATR
jgi:alkanesulfonate monooxygenase SsuD/methylene tetrahydromethanopterin reductase-like flavin-dependent oxidoreductase (luciferase family)